jgi:signal transduction histidine kinase
VQCGGAVSSPQSSVARRAGESLRRANSSPNGSASACLGSSIAAVLRPVPLRAYALAWVPLCAVYVAMFLAGGRPGPTALRSGLLAVLPVALLGLLVLRAPAHLRWRDDRRSRFLAGHLALATLFGATGAAGMLAAWSLEALASTGRLPRFEPLNVAWQAVVCGLIYLAIAGGAYAWENGQRVQAEAGRAAQAETLRTRAELATLRSQLSPHFLLNTLHTVLGLVRRDPTLAEQALERLGEMLHYGLRMHRESLDQISLAAEWSFVRSYLEIEGLRFEERLRLELEIAPDVFDIQVPPFVLQPLVENAVQHAVAPRKEGGRIAVSARRVRACLELVVEDDGPGLPEAAPGTHGLGLRLLRERLTWLYGDRARLDLKRCGRGGLRATIELPLDLGGLAEPT